MRKLKVFTNKQVFYKYKKFEAFIMHYFEIKKKGMKMYLPKSISMFKTKI